MPDKTAANSAPAAGTAGSPFRRFLSGKRVYLAGAALLAYALFGFFAVPALIHHHGVESIERLTERPVQVGDIRFNPFTLGLEINDFTFEDADGAELVSFQQIFIDFQLFSLFRRAWSFREFRLVQPRLFDERFSSGKTRFGQVLDTIQANDARPDSEAGDEPGTPRLYVKRLLVSDGSGKFIDRLPASPVELSTGPITVDVQELSTLPDRRGNKTLNILFPGGAELNWSGEFHLSPIYSRGELSLENWQLGPLLPYLQTTLPLDSFSASASFSTEYRVDLDEAGQVSLQLDKLESSLNGVSVSGLEPASEFLAFDSIELLGGSLTYPQQSLSIAEIRLNDLKVDAWLGEDGEPGLLQLLPEQAAEPASDGGDRAWDIAVQRFAIEGGRLALSDRSIEPNAAVDIQDLSIELRDIDNREGSTMPLSLVFAAADGGQVNFDGSLGLLPEPSIGGTATVNALPVALAEPYLQQSLLLEVDEGLLDLTAELEYDTNSGLSTTGRLQLGGFTASDTRTDQPVMACEQLKVDRFELYLDQAVARISSLDISRPYGRIEIRPDRSTNIDTLVVESMEPAAGAEASRPWTVVVGGIAVRDGAMDFSDLSLPLRFETYVKSLDGTISTIDTGSSEPAGVRLEGQVDEFGLARIEGKLNVVDPTRVADLSVEFRNLAMDKLSPYSAGFAGRQIDQGKLDLDLHYRVQQGLLEGENRIVLRDLLLGQSVESPDAVSLPLDLAVALLKNPEGVIDIELPVEGDINDPEFRIGGIVWRAFTNLVTRIVTAPFSLLGNLIGVDSDDFGQIRFLAGRSDLTPPELEQIGQLFEALEKRPELGLEINGVYDEAVDTPALKFLRLRATVMERLGIENDEWGNGDELLDDSLRSVLEELHLERFPDEALETILAKHAAPPAGDPEGKPVADMTAYSGELIDRLLASQPIGTTELEQLAAQRAQAILDAVLEKGLAPDRVRAAGSKSVESEDGEWVVTELGVSSG